MRSADFSVRGPLEVDPPGTAWGVAEWERVFGRPGPFLLEIGPGKGDWLQAMARLRPEANLVGCEIKRSRSVWIEDKLLRAGIANVRIVTGDALDLVPTMFPPGALAGLYVNFPDPWPRERHRRRRLGGEVLALAAAQLLAVGGELVYVSDHAERAAEAYATFAAHPVLEPVFPAPGWVGELPGYPQTAHERKFRAWGRSIHFMRFLRRP